MSNIVLARLGENIKASTAGQVATSSGSTTAPTLVDNNFSFRNKIINGNFDIWQRSTGFLGISLTNGTYTADRWYVIEFAPGMINSVFKTDFPLNQLLNVSNPPASYLRMNIFTAGDIALAQKIENVSTFSGKTVTCSFWARAQTNTTLRSVILQQNYGTGGSPTQPLNTTISSNIPITTSWTRVVVTGTLPVASGTRGSNRDDSLILRIGIAENYTGEFDITGVQLEEGSFATAFEQRPIGTELALCQRYYWRPTANTPGWSVSTASQANIVNFWLTYPVTMRVAPLLEGANDPPRFTVHSSGLNAQTQPANGYNLSFNALNAEL